MKSLIENLKTTTQSLLDACIEERWEDVGDLEKKQKQILLQINQDTVANIGELEQEIREILSVNQEITERVNQQRLKIKDELIGNRRSSKNINAYKTNQ